MSDIQAASKETIVAPAPLALETIQASSSDRDDDRTVIVATQEVRI